MIPPKAKSFVRKALSHEVHFDGRFGATYFVTICCFDRGRNQLCCQSVMDRIFKTAAIYDKQQKWYLILLLLMPDHLHALLSVGADISLSTTIGNFKRATARFAGIHWQRNFFDHRLRRNEDPADKGKYIRQNPVRAGLLTNEEEWPYVLDRAALSKIAVL